MSTRSERLVHSAVEKVYASASTGCWEEGLTAVADAVGGDSAHLITHDYRDHAGRIIATVRTHPEAIQAYQSHFHHLDSWATSPSMPQVPVGHVFTGEQLVTQSDLAKTEFYAGICKPYGLTRMIGCTATLSADVVSVVTLNRSDVRGSFDRGSAAALLTLVPHIRRALQMQELLGATAGQRDALGDVLDWLDVGVVIMDPTLRILFANREAQRIAAVKDGFFLDHDGPRCASPSETNRLRSALASAALAESAGDALVVPRAVGPGLQLLVLPCGRVPLDAVRLRSPKSILLVRDPTRSQKMDMDLLRTHFGLTPAEAKFAAGLAEGTDSVRLAEQLRMTRATGRWMVQQLRTKLGVHTQGQVVGTIWRSLARVRRRTEPSD